MHAEMFVVQAGFIRKLQSSLHKPIIAVGTTSMRTIESLYWAGLMLSADKRYRELHIGQWKPYQQPSSGLIPTSESLQYVLDYLDIHGLDQFTASTALMIAPGYSFQLVNGLITNFHQPKSTLLLLVAALIGDKWKEAYRFALDNDFRFLSYGDSCLFLS
jgi:S-adenosylmethionine:tRNA ribosyltransferase-isomerase